MNTNNALYVYLLEKVTIEATIKFFVLYFFVIWISIIIWVFRDITNRTEKLYLQIISILIVLIFTPIFGIFIYLIIRPGKTLFEKYYEEVESNLNLLNAQIEEKIKDCNMNKNLKNKK